MSSVKVTIVDYKKVREHGLWSLIYINRMTWFFVPCEKFMYIYDQFVSKMVYGFDRNFLILPYDIGHRISIGCR